jgi:V8-like Glu-specific endopeptidase
MRHAILAMTTFFAGAALLPAGDDLRQPEIVAHAMDYAVAPRAAEAIRLADGDLLWAHAVRVPDAAFLRVHLVNVNLGPGEVLTLRSASGHLVETITGRGPRDLGTFWSLSARGGEILMELRSDERRSEPRFRVDRIMVGDVDPLRRPDSPESICTPADFEDAICYQADAGKWAAVLASVGVMTAGDHASGEWCSGVTVSPEGHVLTNEHCLPDITTCDNAEFIYGYYNTGCNDGSPATTDWVSYRCDETVAASPFVACDNGLNDLDFSLHTAVGNPAESFGYIRPDLTPLASGEAVYIVQHPRGRPHEITHGSGPDVVVDGTVLRYYNTLDTEGGSSGSPIIRDSDDRLVGLHHCGGCNTPEEGNRGVLMADIGPLIADHLCTGTVVIAAADPEDLEEIEGNGDAVVDPGESWRVTPRVVNRACEAPATSVVADATVNPGSSASVTLTGGALSFGDPPASTTASAQMPVAIHVGSSSACGSSIVLDLENMAAAGVGPFPTAAAHVELTVGTQLWSTLLFEDFSGGIPMDWTVEDGGLGGGVAATWTTDNPALRAIPLPHPFAMVDSLLAGFEATQDEGLITPVVDCSAWPDVRLQFAQYFAALGDEIIDVDVRSSLTGGVWVTVVGHSGSDRFLAEDLDISAVAGGAADVQIRFRYHHGSFDRWWAVDSVTVLGADGWTCAIHGLLFADGFETSDTTSWSDAFGEVP